MATQQAPDGTVYEYNPIDPVDVARVAALCEPSYEEKKKRAQAAFEAAAPEAAQQAALGVSTSNAELVNMIASLQQAVAKLSAGGAAPVAHAPIDPGPAPLGASVEASTPVPGSDTPVEGSQGNA